MKVVKFVPALALDGHKARRLQDFQMLRDRLPGKRDLMFHGQPCTQLKESLTIPIDQLVEDRASYGRDECLEDVAHRFIIGKSRLACQLFFGGGQ